MAVLGTRFPALRGHKIVLAARSGSGYCDSVELTGAVAARGRIESLLGLRGLAALIVVVHHCMLRFDVFRQVYADPKRLDDVGSVPWLMVHTPLHLVWAGGEAVFVFFVLSGFVLVLPVIRSKRFSWIAYYPARLIRLYLPVWASIAWALSLFLITRAVSASAGRAWVDERQTTIEPLQIIERSILLHNSNFYNGPLWSIVWEVLFSLLLPLYIVVLLRFRLSWQWKLAVSLLATIIGAYLRSSVPPIGNLLLYMSMFAIGVLMAGNLSTLGELADRISSSPHRRTRWNLTLVGSLLALTAYWFALLSTSNKHLLDMTYVIQLLGAAGLVFSAIFDERVRGCLESVPLRRLGTISFSLYLVHDPIIAMLDYLLGNRIVDFVVGIPLSLAIATVFYFIVERPSHKLARHVASRLAPPPAAAVTSGAHVTSDNSR